MRKHALAGLVLMIALSWAANVAAHQSAEKYVDVAVAGTLVTITITVAPGDVAEAIGLPPDRTVPIAAALDLRAARFVASWLAIGGCQPESSPLATANGGHVVVMWTARCPDMPSSLALDFRPFFAIDPRHEALVTVHATGQRADFVPVRRTAPIQTFVVAPPSVAVTWLVAGVRHVLARVEHACFVIALLVIAVLVRGTRWSVRPPRATVTVVAAIGASWALGQGIALALLGADAIALPPRILASVTAASVAYVAIEDICAPAIRGRTATALAYGVLHGLDAPAGAYTSGTVAALDYLAGNVFGAIAIVAVIVPVCWVAARRAAEPFRKTTLPILAGALAAIALASFYEAVGG